MALNAAVMFLTTLLLIFAEESGSPYPHQIPLLGETYFNAFNEQSPQEIDVSGTNQFGNLFPPQRLQLEIHVNLVVSIRAGVLPGIPNFCNHSCVCREESYEKRFLAEFISRNPGLKDDFSRFRIHFQNVMSILIPPRPSDSSSARSRGRRCSSTGNHCCWRRMFPIRKCKSKCLAVRVGFREIRIVRCEGRYVIECLAYRRVSRWGDVARNNTRHEQLSPILAIHEHPPIDGCQDTELFGIANHISVRLLHRKPSGMGAGEVLKSDLLDQ